MIYRQNIFALVIILDLLGIFGIARKHIISRTFILRENQIENIRKDKIDQIDSLFTVANMYWNSNDFPQYKLLVNKAIYNSIAVKDSGLIGKGYLYLGDYYKSVLRLDSALFFYRKSERIYKKIKKVRNLPTIHLNISEVYFLCNDYYKSETEALNAIYKLRKNGGSRHQFYKAFTLLGIVYNEMDDFPSAHHYLQKAFNLQKKEKFNEIDNQLALVLNNIGNVYQREKKYNQSLRYFTRAVVDRNLQKANPLIYAVIIDNIAYSKFKLGNFDNHIVNLFKESIRIKDSLGSTTYVLFSKCRLSEYYLAMNDTIQAKEVALDALVLARGRPDKLSHLLPLEQLIASDPKNAAKYSQEYIKISDSLQLAERKIRNKFARIEYETDELVIEKDKAIRAKWLYFGSAMAALSLVTLLFVVYRQKTKQTELQFIKNQRAANEEIYRLLLAQQTKFYEGRQVEKFRIARDLHDGVMNRLTSTRLNLFPLTQKQDSETVETCIPYIAGLKEIEDEIRNISHDLTREFTSGSDGFEMLIQSLFDRQKTISSATFHFEMDPKIDWDNIPDKFKINLYRILEEAFQNINKHADADNIFVFFKKLDLMLSVEIIDDGVGYNTAKAKRGIGLKNITSRAADLKGTVEIHSDKGKGVKIKLLFPL